MCVEGTQNSVEALEIEHKVCPVEHMGPEETAGAYELTAPYISVYGADIRTAAGNEEQAVVRERVDEVCESDGPQIGHSEYGVEKARGGSQCGPVIKIYNSGK